ncbi:MAG: bifunctional demethylmenaquinone methyltransferase/2-methoxy-6-polyprenyl-1,4-benzoquinol methylase UbiE [Hyphomicrobiales bacterium]|nr:bifunctional demethylmenaquinone methyltransferase/2-methoxy-6-polyprenyl-1,4-benzoquinol methylase UbiE [Hyphomicrobiales bacterium]
MPKQTPRPEPGTGGRSGTTHFGFASVREDDKQTLVNSVFAKVAPRYDLMNDLMSGGLHRLWKDELINWLNPPRGATPFTLLDVAGGTGDIAQRFLSAAGEKATCLVCDISGEMLQAGRRKFSGRDDNRAHFVQANAESLPLPDASLDAYTIGFGIRNVTRKEQALQEAWRVLRPGGRFLCLEFSEVQVPLLDTIYDRYSFNAIPALGAVVAGDAESYRYLVESIRNFPDQDNFATMIADAGFERVDYRNLTGGIAALHSGWKL